MTATADDTVPLADVERLLADQFRASGPGAAVVHHARMSNLIVYSDHPERVAELEGYLQTVVAQHPARVLLLLAEPGSTSPALSASVKVWCRPGAPGRCCSEQITLRAWGTAVERLPYEVRGLLIGDLPTNLLWATPAPPPLAGPLLAELTEQAQQVVYDSIGWAHPPRDVAATARWLERFDDPHGPWQTASDLNWRRLRSWRRLLSQTLAPDCAPGALESITEVRIDHGPHAVVQAWLLVSWLASRLGWRVEAGRVEPGVEITWQAEASHGPVRLHIHRLSEGPAEVRRLRIACRSQGNPATFDITVAEDRRLAVAPEGCANAPRTLTIKPQSLPEMVARQLSDREPDPVFRESMRVAQVFAESLLH